MVCDDIPRQERAQSPGSSSDDGLDDYPDSLNYLGIMTSVGCREMPLGGTRLSSFGSLEPFDPSESASVEKFRMRGEDVLNLRWQLDPGYVWSITSGDLAIAKSMGLEVCKILRFRTVTLAVSLSSRGFQLAKTDLAEILDRVMTSQYLRKSKFRWLEPCNGTIVNHSWIHEDGKTTPTRPIVIRWHLLMVPEHVWWSDIHRLEAEAALDCPREEFPSASASESGDYKEAL